MHVPSKVEWELLDGRGVRQAASDMGHLFWTSSRHPEYIYNAFFFDGGNGGIDYFVRGNSSYSVRCVSGQRGLVQHP
jgi:hypothetical protein